MLEKNEIPFVGIIQLSHNHHYKLYIFSLRGFMQRLQEVEYLLVQYNTNTETQKKGTANFLIVKIFPYFDDE